MNSSVVHQLFYLGVDVSEDYLDLYSEIPGVPKRIAYTRSELSKLLTKLRRCGTLRVACEASGRCEELLKQVCLKLDIAIYVVNGQRVREYARSQGQLAKTDAIDAHMICLYARATSKLRPITPLDAPTQALNALSTRRRQLIGLRVAERNRLRRAAPIARPSLLTSVRFLDKLIAKIDADLLKIVSSSASLRAKVDRLTSVNGVGFTSAVAIIAFLPEIGLLSKNQISSLAGLAPFPDDSATRTGKRHITGGRVSARNALYMPALVASRSNQVIRDFYLRLRANGKSAKVALTASMRKLLIHLNSLLKSPAPLPS